MIHGERALWQLTSDRNMGGGRAVTGIDNPYELIIIS